MLLRDLLARARHEDWGGRAGKAELLTGVEGVSSWPVRRIVLRGRVSASEARRAPSGSGIIATGGNAMVRKDEIVEFAITPAGHRARIRRLLHKRIWDSGVVELRPTAIDRLRQPGFYNAIWQKIPHSQVLEKDQTRNDKRYE